MLGVDLVTFAVSSELEHGISFDKAQFNDVDASRNISASGHRFHLINDTKSYSVTKAFSLATSQTEKYLFLRTCGEKRIKMERVWRRWGINRGKGRAHDESD